MADDMHIERLIREAQEAACKPMAFKDLKPHERAMVGAIGVVGEQNCLTDAEMVSGMKNVLTYLLRNLKRTNEGSRTPR